MNKHDPSNPPRCLPLRPELILQELKACANWVMTKVIWKNGRWTKPPMMTNGGFAKVSDPASWTTFDAVCAAYSRGNFDGIGYVLDGKPLGDGRYLHGFDWDDCVEIDPLTGEMCPLPEVILEIDKLGISRLEYSLTGTGLRGFFLHGEPLKARKQRVGERSVEVYSSQRFLTVTGWCLPGREELL